MAIPIYGHKYIWPYLCWVCALQGFRRCGFVILTTFRRTPMANAEGQIELEDVHRKGLGEMRIFFVTFFYARLWMP